MEKIDKLNKKYIHIHIICSGNAYRSRLAETYLISKKIPYIVISSSGLEADENRSGNGPICWYALRALAKYNLLQHLPKTDSTQTQKTHLINADIIIFMRDVHYQKAKERFNFGGNYEIWDIPDINEINIPVTSEGYELDKQIILASETAFTKIRQKADELILRLLEN